MISSTTAAIHLMTTMRIFVFLLRLVSVSVLCIPYIDHAYSFQSMYTPPRPRPRTLHGMRTDGFQLRSLDRNSPPPLKLSSSALSEEFNSTPSKPNPSKYDIQWEKKFDLLCTYREREGYANVPISHNEAGENLGEWLSRQRRLYRANKLQAARQAKLESVGVRFDGAQAEVLERQWERMFNLLCSYKEREGTAYVPKNYEEEGVKLGIWVNEQQKSFKAGKLQAERQHRLESLGVEWNNLSAYEAKLEKRWENNFDLLCRCKEIEGSANIPNRHEEDGVKLGMWLKNQREAYRNGTLQEERRIKLESLGVDLNLRGSPISYDEMWAWKFDLLCRYKEREGNANIPNRHEEDGVKLGLWLYNQRRSYKFGTLQEDRQKKLESIGVQWDGMSAYVAMLDNQWGNMFDVLCIYKERVGHANVQDGHKENGENIGTWLKSQREAYRDGTLQAEREDKLESLGVKWDGNEVDSKRLEMQWEKTFDLLCTYREREGHANVPISHNEAGENLGKWLSRQREAYRDGTLQAERLNKLESIGIRWKMHS